MFQSRRCLSLNRVCCEEERNNVLSNSH